MSFKITIVEVFDEVCVPQEVKRYEQTVDQIDLKAVMQAVNQKPRKVRVRKAKVQA